MLRRQGPIYVAVFIEHFFAIYTGYFTLGNSLYVTYLIHTVMSITE